MNEEKTRQALREYGETEGKLKLILLLYTIIKEDEELKKQPEFGARLMEILVKKLIGS